jgi:hypothetical protein
MEVWRSDLQKFAAELWKDHDSDYPSKLYHYSGMQGIRGILSSREVWSSDVLSMTDTTDGRYWLDIFRSVIDRHSVPGEIKDGFRRTDTFGLGTNWHMYISSFSEANNLDHQWRNYAEAGSGCAIELSFEAMRAKAEGGRYAWMKLLYDPKTQKYIAERAVKHAIQFARTQSLTSSEAKIYWQQYATFLFLRCGVCFKHPNYKEEREWRVFITKTNLNGVRTRASINGSRISYIGLPAGTDVVTGLVIGPACVSAKAELLALLEKAGYTQHIVERN